MIRFVLGLFLVTLFHTSLPTQGKAEVLEWTLRNEYRYIVYVKFFSKNRNHEWPGNGNTYVFNDSANHTQRLSCRRGEKICFGGFNADRSLYWGVGEHGNQGCSTCCRTCGDYYTDVDVLN